MSALGAARAMIVGWTRLGVDPDAPEHNTQHIVLANQLALFFAAVTGVAALGPFMTQWAPAVRIGTIAIALALVPGVLVLNAMKQHLAAVMWMVIVVFGMDVFVARHLPNGTQHLLFLMLVCTLPLFVFARSRRVLAVVTTALLAAGYAAVQTWHLVDPPQVPADPSFVELIGHTNRLAVLGLLLGLAYYATRQTRRVEDELHERNAELSDALATLKETQTKLVLTQKLVSLADLVAGVSHELNTPLGAMKSSASSAERALARLRKKPDDRLLDILADTHRVIGDATERVVEVVDMLRSFARLDGADWQIANVDEELKRTLKLTGHRFDEAMTIVEEYGDTPDIHCRPRQLNQLFANLLVNAAQAMDPEGTLTVRTQLLEGSVLVEIIDDGEGIAPGDLGRVVDPGFTTRGVGVGVGLGLAVAYSIATEHGGALDIESEGKGRGTRASVSIPLQRRDDEREPAQVGGL